MEKSNLSTALPETTAPAQEHAHFKLSIRIAGTYLIMGILWIAISDFGLALAGGLTTAGFLIAMSKGALFVVLSTGLIFWLCRREYLKIYQATSLLRSVIEGTPDAIFVKDRSGRYQLVNAAAARVLGRSVIEILGKDDRELCDEPDAQRLMTNDKVIMESRQAVTLEETMTVDGTTRVYQATKAPLFDVSGAVMGLIGISRNITDQKQVESTLLETDARLREAQRIARLGSWSWEPPTNRTWWSDAEFELFGVHPLVVEPGLESFLSFLHPDDRSIAIARVDEMLAGANEFANDLRIARRDGTCMWIHSRARATRDSDGNLLRVEGTDQDITADRLARETAREQEMLVREAAELAQVGGWGIDPVTMQSDWTPEVARMYGLPHDSPPPPDNALNFFHEEQRPALTQAIAAAIQHGIPHDMELQLNGADGERRWVRTICRPIVENGKVIRVRGSLQDITERKRIESEHERAAALLRSVLDSVGDAIVTINSQGSITSINSATERLFGYAVKELIGVHWQLLLPQSLRDLHDRYLLASREQGMGREVECLRKDGTTFPAELTITEFKRDGEMEFTGVVRDITARRHLEDQFRHAVKMEAVGRLAGGVAHDFNNLLTVINGYSEMVLADLSATDPSRSPLSAIHDAGERAARLTEQLLAFSRKSIVEPKLVDLNELVLESARLFRRLIGEDITLDVITDPAPLFLMVDPGQVEQVLMNLAVNARDAMPTGGRLTIASCAVQLSRNTDRGNANLPAGPYVALKVSDTGSGMSPEVQEKIFEPFFTTKEMGKGTGLGLAVVHGIVQQSGGSIRVESSVGQGSTFHVLFPAVSQVPQDSHSIEAAVAPRGNETVLVVEDEDAVRTLVRVVLEGQGYKVLTASNGNEAHEILLTYKGKVDLLVTDVIMPEVSGRVLAGKLRAIHPELRILYMSGYTDDALDRHGLRGPSDQFIQKPFTPLSLARRVREIVDQ